MHPRQPYAVLKPQINRLDPRQRLAQGVLGAWLMNDDGGVRASPTSDNYPKEIVDSSPFGYSAWADESVPDELKTVTSPWGQGVAFPVGNYGEINYQWGQHWDGAPGISTFAIVRRHDAGHDSNVLTAGQFGTSTAKVVFQFETGNTLYYGSRTQTEGIQFQRSVATFGADEWFVVGGTANPVTGAGEYRLYSNGIRIATTGTTPNHAADNYDGGIGSWQGHLGGIDYALNTWAKVDIVFCMHWGWTLTDEDMMSLYRDPYQAFYRPEGDRYASWLKGAEVSYYLVNLAKTTGQNIKENVRTVLVDANDANTARDMAESLYEGDADWDDAAVSLLEATTDPYVGSKWNIRVSGAPIPSPDIVNVNYTAGAGETLDTVMAGIVAVLNGPGTPITTAAWGAGTLTIAGVSESLGDRTVTIEITPGDSKTSIPNRSGMPLGSITHEGASGAALSASFSDAGLPRILAP